MTFSEMTVFVRDEWAEGKAGLLLVSRISNRNAMKRGGVMITRTGGDGDARRAVR